MDDDYVSKKGNGQGVISNKIYLKFEEADSTDRIDEQMGFVRYVSPARRKGWLINARSTLVRDSEWGSGRSAVDFYFIEDDGSCFKSTLVHSPYFYLRCRNERESEEFLRKKYGTIIEKIEKIDLEDLDMSNHLTGLRRSYLKLYFRNINDMLTVRKPIMNAVEKNQEILRENGTNEYIEEAFLQIAYEDDDTSYGRAGSRRKTADGFDSILEIREYDITYHQRVMMDHDIRVGLWYQVSTMNSGSSTLIQKLSIQPVRPDPVVIAFDIETTKLPLRFPDASIDSIMMISYMIDNSGYLIVNRDIVSQDISDFEYSPTLEYQGNFKVFNEPNEQALLVRFFEHIQLAKPTVFVTYNGDFFDWPFIEARASIHHLDLKSIIGVCHNNNGEDFEASYATHMDVYKWVKRDSYLPAGSQGLKAVTKIKLGYSPLEVDPEEMLRFAKERPQDLASYSVSDSLCTYHLYMKYVHPFIFSLCSIIPLSADEVLRKGSGTLCEALLMAESSRLGIVMPNKSLSPLGATYEGHLLSSETYVGGHVEALASGVFRNDIPTKFVLDSKALTSIAEELDTILAFALDCEDGNYSLDDVIEYETVKESLNSRLRNLATRKTIMETPLIYHLDVAAMYPNIMLTNRLQPPSIVTERDCAVCDYNKPGKTCQRKMNWSWRGEIFVAKRNELRMIQNQLEGESFPLFNSSISSPSTVNNSRSNIFDSSSLVVPFTELPPSDQNTRLRARLTQYCKKIYKKIHETKVVERESIVCMRENGFYVDTVRQFRDRRYDYKSLQKDAKKALDSLLQGDGCGDAGAIAEARKTLVLYDSLQLAHKCILNSFYGYVMRKGARWYSMEMAGIVCLTGASIITAAREEVERLGGRPLELDTDGIWCMLPASFPDNISLAVRDRANPTKTKTLHLSFPCVLLNRVVHGKFTNHQYETLVDPIHRKYIRSSENSIFFEIDGPYRAMILPSSTEEDRLLKKRYAVYSQDGCLAELKGFEVKRRGELQLTKIFQTEVFDAFLQGSSLVETYAAVARVADRWLDVLLSHGKGMQEHEIFELLSERKSMSKGLDEYGAMKSTAISTARRLAEFLGDSINTGSSSTGSRRGGLTCTYVISERPHGIPVAQRAIPVAIFSSEDSIKEHYLRLWTKDTHGSLDLVDLLDWNYYLERFYAVVQKLISIPASMQGLPNPVPRVPLPDWMIKRSKKLLEDSGEIGSNQLKLRQFAEDPNLKLPLHQTPLSELVDFRSESQKHRDAEELQLKTAENEKSDRLEALIGKISLSDGNYNLWLQVMKSKWRRDRQSKSLNKPISLRQHWKQSAQNEDSVSIGNSLLNIWHVLSVQETSTPGEFDVWIIYVNLGSRNSHKMKKVRVAVPRLFYLHTSVNQQSSSSTDPFPFKRLLDHTLLCSADGEDTVGLQNYVYEIDMPEKLYLEHIEDWDKLAAEEDGTLLQGLYERDIPPSYRALLKLSSTIQPTANGLSQLNTDRIDWRYIISRADAANQYLSLSNTHLIKQYLYLAIIEMQPMGSSSNQSFATSTMVFLLVNNEIQIWIEEKHVETSIASISPTWLKECLTTCLDGPYLSCYLDYPISVVPVKPSNKGKDSKLWASVKAYLEKSIFKSTSTSASSFPPFVCLLQTSGKPSEILMGNLLMTDIMPVFTLPNLSAPFESFVARLQWQRSIVKDIAKSMEKVNSYWIDEQVAFSRAVNIPLCNLTGCSPSFILIQEKSNQMVSEKTRKLTSINDDWIKFEHDKCNLAHSLQFVRYLKMNRYILTTRSHTLSEYHSQEDLLAVGSSIAENGVPLFRKKHRNTESSIPITIHGLPPNASNYVSTTTRFSAQSSSSMPLEKSSTDTDYAEDAASNALSFSHTLKDGLGAVINQPGYYATIVLELELSGLLVSSLLQIDQGDTILRDSIIHPEPSIASEEFHASSGFSSSEIPLANYLSTQLHRQSTCFGNVDYPYGSGHFNRLLGLLKTYVSNLAKHVLVSRCKSSDLLLASFERWLYQSSIGQFVVSDKDSVRLDGSASPFAIFPQSVANYIRVDLVKKALVSLVRHWNLQGARCVYLSRSRVLLATRKSGIANAKAYMEYLLKSLISPSAPGRSKSIPSLSFSWLTFKPIYIYKGGLLWMNSENFSAMEQIPYSDDQSIPFADSDTEGSEEIEESAEVYQCASTYPMIQQNSSFSETSTKTIHSRKRRLGAFAQCWHMIRHFDTASLKQPFPHSLQVAFSDIIQEYMEHLRNFQDHHISARKYQLRLEGLDGPYCGLFSESSQHEGSEVHNQEMNPNHPDNAFMEDVDFDCDLPEDSVLRLHRYGEPAKRHKIDSSLDTYSSSPNNLLDPVRNDLSASLPREFTMRLFRLLKQVSAFYYSKASIRLDDKENEISKNYSKINIPLAFVKCLCAVLFLETRLTHQIRLLRKQWLSMLQVPEFSDVAIFQLDCTQLLIKGIPCTLCFEHTDLNLLCRPESNELYLASSSSSSFSALSSHSSPHASLTGGWICGHCRAPFPISIVEEFVVAKLSSLYASYNMQDAICIKCKLPRECELHNICKTCTGAYITPISAAIFLSTLRPFEILLKLEPSMTLLRSSLLSIQESLT